MSSDISHSIPLTGEGRSLGGKISGGTGRPPASILIPLERQLMLYNFAADSFCIIKLCSRLFVLHCRSRPKYDTSMHFDPHFEEIGGSVEPWWMARWKARAEFLLSVIELLFTVRHKRCISYGNSVRLSVRHTPVLCQNDDT